MIFCLLHTHIPKHSAKMPRIIDISSSTVEIKIWRNCEKVLHVRPSPPLASRLSRCDNNDNEIAKFIEASSSAPPSRRRRSFSFLLSFASPLPSIREYFFSLLSFPASSRTLIIPLITYLILFFVSCSFEWNLLFRKLLQLGFGLGCCVVWHKPRGRSQKNWEAESNSFTRWNSNSFGFCLLAYPESLFFSFSFVSTRSGFSFVWNSFNECALKWNGKEFHSIHGSWKEAMGSGGIKRSNNYCGNIIR